MRTTVPVLLVALLTSAVTASAQTIDAGRGELPLRVPADYSEDTPTPLVVSLHGYGSSGAGQASYMKFGELVDSHGFLLVYPDGTKQSTGENPQFWNASEACCNFAGSTIDDSAYVLSIITTVAAEYNVDPKRIYLFGHSNGGFMAYRMACDRADKVTAIASLAGATFLDDSKCKPSQAVNVLQIHGTLDPLVGYKGGNFFGKPFPGAEESVAKWRKLNDCDGTATKQGKVSYDYKVFGNETSRTLWQDCKQGVEVGLWKMSYSTHVPVFTGAFQKDVVAYLLARTRQ